MPAAHFLIVERQSADVFRITWWGRSGRRVEELATHESLTRRCDVLTMPDHEIDTSKDHIHDAYMDGPRC
jgi:hypothetical protein